MHRRRDIFLGNWATSSSGSAFRGGRFTRVNGLFSFLIAVGLTGLFYGFLFLLGSKSLSGILGPDWKWAIGKSKEDLAPLAKEIVKVAHANGYQSKRDVAVVIASFVQNVCNKTPSKFYVYPDLRRVETAELSLPLDTLCNGYGDCDSFSVLFAGIMANIPGQEVIFMVGKKNHDHLFVGVKLDPEFGEENITYGGDKYVLVELTVECDLGDIPLAEIKAYHDKKLVPVKVVN